ncbi:hypothetical protein FBU30_006593 [Linnemannia zychae]|nr:hypothetical protein FBU30_006593 [Linnemannia zychae]
MSTTPDATHFVHKNTHPLALTLKEPALFKLFYFPIHSNGATSREILSVAESKWENLVPKDVMIAEAGVIEQYLAKQFGLMGDNEYEENIIKSFHSSTAALHALHATTVAFIPDRIQREKAMRAFRDGPFRTWVSIHEKHLHDNGSNGYYIDKKLTLADIRTSNLIEHLLLQTGGQELHDVIVRSTSLNKVRIQVASDAKVRVWRSSAPYKQLTNATTRYFDNPVSTTAATGSKL